MRLFAPAARLFCLSAGLLAGAQAAHAQPVDITQQVKDQLDFGGITLGPGDYAVDDSVGTFDSIHISGTPFTRFEGRRVPVFNGVFTQNKAVALAAGVIRYFPEDEARAGYPAGWYLIKDRPFQHHDPVLVGGVDLQDDYTVKVGTLMREYGLDTTKWTPAGGAVSPDESYAVDGVIFGASVAPEELRIKGSYTGTRDFQLTRQKDGRWTSSDTLISAVPSSDGRSLVVSRRLRRSAFDGSGYPLISVHHGPDAPPFTASVHTLSDETYRISFRNRWGFKVDLAKTDLPLSLNVHDPALPPRPYDFSAPPAPGTNIWFIYAFTLREAMAGPADESQ